MSKESAIRKAISELIGPAPEVRLHKNSVHLIFEEYEVNFNHLLKLSKMFGTTHIDFRAKDASGCDTCGPMPQMVLEITGVTKWPT